VKAGFRDIVRMRTDADLAALTGDPRFERLLRRPL
jgi:hypothetical protein